MLYFSRQSHSSRWTNGAVLVVLLVAGMGCSMSGSSQEEKSAGPSAEAQSYVELAEIETGSYDAFGPILQVADSTLFLAYRTARSHVSPDGLMVGRISTDLGRTWSESFEILSDPDLVIRGASGGMRTENDDVLLFHRRGRQLEAIRSQGLLGWESPRRVFRPSDGVANAAGNPIRIGQGKVMRGLYTSGTEQSVSVVFSDDEGRSWGSPVKVLSRRGGGHNYNEASYVHLGDRIIVGLVRDNEGTSFVQVRSENNGRTWTVEGQVPFSYGEGAAHPPFLLPVKRSDGKDWVVCLYANRLEKELRMTGIPADELRQQGVSGWKESPDLRLATFTRGRSGYPSATQVDSNGQIIGWYYDEKTVSDADPVVFSVNPIQEFQR